MSKPKSLHSCKSGKHFVSYSARQGAHVREGSRHTIIKTDKGSVAVPRHGNKDLATGTWHAVVKGLIGIGIVLFMMACGISNLVPAEGYDGAVDFLSPALGALESVIAWVIAA